MPIHVTCPQCHATYRVADDSVGKKVRCKTCECFFLIAKADEPEDEPIDVAYETDDEPSPRRSTSSTQIRNQRHADDYEDDADDAEDRRRLRKKRKAQAANQRQLKAVLLISGGVAVGLGLFCLVSFLLVSFRAHQAVPPAFGPPPGVMPNGFGPPANPLAQSGPNNPQPNVPPPNFPAAPQVQVVLSNPKITRGLGLSFKYSVQYQFTQGAPRIGEHYRWVISSAQGQGGIDYMGHELSDQGTLYGEQLGGGFRGGFGDNGPWEMTLEHRTFPGAFGQGRRISNAVTAQK